VGDGRGEEDEKEVEEEEGDALVDMGLSCSHGFCAFAWMRTEERREERREKTNIERGEESGVGNRRKVTIPTAEEKK
jgi:hypothetical protein